MSEQRIPRDARRKADECRKLTLINDSSSSKDEAILGPDDVNDLNDPTRQVTDVEQRAVYDHHLQSHSTPQMAGDDAPVTSATNGIQPDSAEEADNDGNEMINGESSVFKREQQEDHTLADLWTLARKGDDKYITDNGFLFKRGKPHGDDDGVQKQLLLPVAFRKRVLELAHDSNWAGHRGVKATTARINKAFCWPSMTQDIQTYVRSCPECQRTATIKTADRAPLIEVPVIDEPFHTVVLDVLGPINPKSSSGKRFVLILVEQTTHWPEFIPLSSVTAKAVAKALIEVFARTGIPKVIKSDNGTHFKNQLVKGLEDLLGISPVFSTVGHHETAGSAERMIRVVREMLRKSVADDPRSWDAALPLLAFSCRQIPSTVTGFSPFELLYAHDVRGPMQVVHDAWTGRLHTTSKKRSVIDFLTTTQDHLKKCVELATEQAQEARKTAKAYYDRKSTNRVLEIGQEVLLLRHSTENKLLAKWEGPFTVTRKLSAVNYEIMTEKGPKAYHINLLRLWHARESNVHIPKVNVILTAEPCEGDYETLGAIDDDGSDAEEFNFNEGFLKHKGNSLKALCMTSRICSSTN